MSKPAFTSSTQTLAGAVFVIRCKSTQLLRNHVVIAKWRCSQWWKWNYLDRGSCRSLGAGREGEEEERRWRREETSTFYSTVNHASLLRGGEINNVWKCGDFSDLGELWKVYYWRWQPQGDRQLVVEERDKGRWHYVCGVEVSPAGWTAIYGINTSQFCTYLCPDG